MLSFRKIIIVTIFIVSFLNAQSILNGYGIGKKNNDFDAAAQSISSSGLVPSFGYNVSLQNPSTWHNLGYTYFTGSYNSDFSRIGNIDNEQSALGNAQFIIPIKNKYSFGFGVVPYFDQFLELKSNNEVDFIAFKDTLTTSSSYSSFGGVTEFNISVGGNVLPYFTAAIKIGALYGSARQETIFTINNVDYYLQNRNIYSGTLAKLYLNSDILAKVKVPMNLYLSYGLPIKSISVNTNNYRPFEDSDLSGSQNFYDFPSSLDAASAIEEELDEVSIPHEYQLGFDYKLNNTYNILGELSNWNDKSDKGTEISNLNEQIKSYNQFSIAFAKFAPEIVKNPLDRFNFKLGLYSRNTELLKSEKIIKEYGVSTGLGFNFGITKNQIDFAYSLGKREGMTGVGDETIQRFSVGITVGDIWFVKRRAQ